MLQTNRESINADSIFYPELTIQKGDLLYIGVTSKDPLSDVRYNLNNYYTGGTQAVPSASSVLGYLVDKEGMIKFADVGAINVLGTTTSQLAEFLRNKLSLYLKDPIITVRYLNFKITVLGEVAKPGTYQISTEKLSIIEALGLAGDLTIYGQRENIMIIREKDGKRFYEYLDLTKGDIFKSPYFYLEQNDAIFVSMNNKKVANSDQTLVRNLSLATGIISTIAIIISVFK